MTAVVTDHRPLGIARAGASFITQADDTAESAGVVIREADIHLSIIADDRGAPDFCGTEFCERFLVSVVGKDKVGDIPFYKQFAVGAILFHDVVESGFGAEVDVACLIDRR